MAVSMDYVSTQSSRFKDCLLPDLEETGRVFGRGAFGVVVEMKLPDGTIVAGKKIHSIFFEPDNDPNETKSVKERFEQECIRMSQLNHPNLVKFLGVHYKLGSDIPILIMEYLPLSLTECLKQKIIPNYIKNSILLDVSRGLLYLHTLNPPVLHRDLTANNVLLTLNMSAKITDLGVSRVFEPEAFKIYMRMSTCPGTMVYMPPEAQKLNYKETNDTFNKLDVFSFGVLILHVYTQEWPEPADAFDEDNMPRTEVQKRAHLLESVEIEDLKQLAEQCLNNRPQLRPHTIDLVKRISNVVNIVSETIQQKSLQHLTETCDSSSEKDLKETGQHENDVNSTEALKFTSHPEVIISDDKPDNTASDLQYKTAEIEPKIKDTPLSLKDLVNRKVNRMYQVNDGNLTTSFLSSPVFKSPQDFQETETVDFRESQPSLLKRSMTMEASSDVDSIISSFYNHHRARSTQCLTTQSFIQSDDHTPALSIPSNVQQPKELSKVQVESKTKTFPLSQVYSRSPKFFKKKRKSKRTLSPESKSCVIRYQPGVLFLKGSMRECLIQRMLQEKESEFCEKKTIKLFCGSWNVNGQQAIQRMDKWLLCNEDIPDIFAIGFQELDLSTKALVTKESNREEMWVDLVESSLKLAGSYKRISVIRLVGILLLVYVSKEIIPYISDVDFDMVPCGIMGHLGNKGGVAVRFNIFHSSICIVNSHLAAHVEEVEKRNQDYHQIYSRLQFFKSSTLPYSIMDHNFVIWMGDLNYRINTSQEMTPEIIRAMADSYQFSILLRHDQLVQQQKKGEAFNQFQEPPIDFKPTYKYYPLTNIWDSSEELCAPAWCDRVLYHSEDNSIKVLKYVSHPEMIISDHKPVSATCDLEVKVVIPEKERDVLEHINWKLDKQENETLPQVELNSLEFKFNSVKFMVPQRQYLQIHNVGQRPVQLSFLTTRYRDTICKPWLSIKPDRAIILTEEEVTIELSVLIDSEIVSSFNNGREKLEDILVLHLEGGKDFFISISGSFLPSCFGSSLKQLIHHHTYIHEVPTSRSSDLTLSSSWEEFDEDTTSVGTSPPPLDIPKELHQLVTHLTNHGLKVESLFTDGGLTIEREKIRDILDTGGSELPGSVYSVAACLLTFLRSLSEPVIPRSFHQQCMEGCQNHILCRQIILKISTVHRRVFVYIITFLKKILDHSHVNQMDAKFLASVFGDILLCMSREMRLSHTKKTLVDYNQKKVNFIYQFLTNDLTIEYK